MTFYFAEADDNYAGLDYDENDVPDGHAYLVAGSSTPSSAVGFSPLAEWFKQNDVVGAMVVDHHYEDAAWDTANQATIEAQYENDIGYDDDQPSPDELIYHPEWFEDGQPATPHHEDVVNSTPTPKENS